MSDQTDPKRCRKADCQVARTGSCAEGHTPLASCPNFGDQPAETSHVYDGELDTVLEGAKTLVELVSLSSGGALTLEEVDQFLRWRAATFVTIIGDRESGKTTLISALYERFLKGTFANLGFAGSRTLVGLERRSHFARVDSGRTTPDTEHTSLQEGLLYFHLAVAPIGNPRQRTDLLLSDRSGEFYRSARDKSKEVANLPEIPQADRIVLLLDGGRLASLIERAGAIQSVRQILRVFLDNDALGSTSAVQVVTTKIDLIAASEDAQVIADVLAEFRHRLAADFEPRLKSLSFYDIAARDPTCKFAPAYGVDKLIKDWTTTISRYPTPASPPVALHSEFDRLLARTPMDILP